MMLSLNELSLETTNQVGLIPQKSCQLIVCCLNEVNPNSIALFSSLNKSLQDNGEIRVIYHKLAKESYEMAKNLGIMGGLCLKEDVKEMNINTFFQIVFQKFVIKAKNLKNKQEITEV